ncbi:MAG: GNAT family N-acetyltransferase [Pseudomonadota bacterium]
MSTSQRTDRLILRAGQVKDIDALVSAMSEHDVVSQLSSVPWPYSSADARKFIERMQRDGLPRYLIFEATDSGERLVGGCGVTGSAEHLKIGYWVHKAHWGRGIATEAVSALLGAIANQGYDRVFAEHKMENVSSLRVLEKLGFVAIAAREEGVNAPAKSDPSLVLRVKAL